MIFYKSSLLLALSVMTLNAFADEVSDPCRGPTELLNIVNRPSIADSACTVPYKKADIEAGYQYLKLTEDMGHAQNYPQGTVRVGLPDSNEIEFLLPNYNHQTMAPHGGVGPLTIGLKHVIGYTANWLGSIEALTTFPTGSDAFGSDGVGEAVNGIVSYTFNPKFNILFLLGISTQTEPTLSNGMRFTSVNGDVVLTYSATSKLDIYAEVAGQSKTAPNESSGFNFDGGLVYLLLPQATVDLEYAHRINGNLGGIEHYVGAGFAVEIG